MLYTVNFRIIYSFHKYYIIYATMHLTLLKMLYRSEFVDMHIYNYYNFLAFNTYKLHSFLNNYQLIKLKRIQSQACNKIIINKVLLKNMNINLDTFHNVHNYRLNIKYISKLLQKLKSSGYISSIRIFNVHTQNYKYITLNLTMNPVIRKISIFNYKKLKIPSHLLKYVFTRQIGMPKNYNLINNSLQFIYLWYKSRGFAWVTIKLVEENILNPHSIYLKIMEGTIKDVQLTCSTNNVYNSRLTNILNSLIKKELGIYPGSILNIKKIESGIRHLTNLNLIKDCNYIIKRDRANLIVFLKYSILNNHIDYFYNYNSILENYPNYRQVYNLFNTCLTKFKLFRKNIMYIQKFYIYSSVIHIDSYLGFTYKSFYSKNNINNISANFITTQDYPQLEIVFSRPYIYRENKIISHLIIYLYNKITKPYLCYPFLLVELNKVNNSQKSNLLMHLYSKICLLKHNLTKNINISEKDLIIYKKYVQVDIHMKDYQFGQFIIKKSSLRKKIFSVTKLLKHIRYQLVYLHISIIYNNLYFWNHLKAGKLMKIYSKLFTYITKNYNNIGYNLTYLGNNIGIKYMQVFNLPKIFTYIHHHTLIIFSECYFWVNSCNYSTILHELYNKKNIYFNFKGSCKKNFPLHFFYLFNIKYHIYTFKHTSIYWFCSYINYSYIRNQHKPHVKTIEKIYTHEIIIGSGIKFYIPIKKLPNICLEYSIGSEGEHFLGLRTDPKYNE